MMKKRNSILMAGLVVATVLVAGISVNAAGDVIEDTVETVKERMGGHSRGGEQRGGNEFTKAVEDGTLTQTEADAIVAYREANRPDRQAIEAELEGLTREETKAYMEATYPRSEDHLADLVEAGLLTDEQVAELETFRSEFDGERARGFGSKGNMKENRNGFENAVEDGILTEAEVAAIEDYHDANAPDKELIETELEGLTREEAKAYMEENYPRSENPLADLVDEELLTQDQADQLGALRENAVGERQVREDANGERPERTERPDFDGEQPEGLENRGNMKGGRGMRPAESQEDAAL